MDRICRPLGLNSTQITLNSQLRARLAQGYNEFGYEAPAWDYLVLAGCGALRSTVNDQLKYVSASLGLVPSSLASTMEKTRAVHFRRSADSELGLGWFVRNSQTGKIICHDGGTGGYASFVGFDKSRRRGVVVLSNVLDDVGKLGLRLLEREWQANLGPLFSEKQTAGQSLKSKPLPPRQAIKLNVKLLDACVGHYEFPPNTPFPSTGMKTVIKREAEQLVWQAWAATF